MMQNNPVNTRFTPDDRTYLVSEERLKAFKALSPAQRLQWVEELAYFLRLAKVQNSSHHQDDKLK